MDTEQLIKEIDPDYANCHCCNKLILKSDSKCIGFSESQYVCRSAVDCVENMEEYGDTRTNQGT